MKIILLPGEKYVATSIKLKEQASSNMKVNRW